MFWSHVKNKQEAYQKRIEMIRNIRNNGYTIGNLFVDLYH